MARISIVVTLVVALCLVGLTAAQPKPKLPPPWPEQLVMQQVGYWPSQGNAKTNSMWYYDYTNLRHRFDHETIRNTPFGIFPNRSSEIWLGPDLYMYNWDKNTCIHNHLGISIPSPDWFIGNSSTLGTLQYMQHEDYYYETVQTATPGPYYREYGPYNYYAFSSSGIPFRMSGPGTALGVVVNDWYNFNATAPNPGLFVLPSSPSCTSQPVDWSMVHHTSLMFAALAKTQRV